MASNFYSDLEQGKITEGLVSARLCERGWRVIDVSDSAAHQRQGIDLIAMKNTEVRSIEIKRDNRIGETDNLFIELFCNGPGWFHNTAADYLFVHDTRRGKLYITEMESIRNYLDNYVANYIEYDQYDGNISKHYKAYLIPLDKYVQYYDLQVEDMA